MIEELTLRKQEVCADPPVCTVDFLTPCAVQEVKGSEQSHQWQCRLWRHAIHLQCLRGQRLGVYEPATDRNHSPGFGDRVKNASDIAWLAARKGLSASSGTLNAQDRMPSAQRDPPQGGDPQNRPSEGHPAGGQPNAAMRRYVQTGPSAALQEARPWAFQQSSLSYTSGGFDGIGQQALQPFQVPNHMQAGVAQLTAAAPTASTRQQATPAYQPDDDPWQQGEQGPPNIPYNERIAVPPAVATTKNQGGGVMPPVIAAQNVQFARNPNGFPGN